MNLDIDSNASNDADSDQKEKEILPEKRQAYLPGKSLPLKNNETLEFDKSAYRLYHSFETEHPCLSFDVILDDDGENRESYPIDCRIVTGTQSNKIRNNELMTIKLTNLTVTNENEESDSDDDDDESKIPAMHSVVIPHHGAINRIRSANMGVSTICAIWNDQSKVQLWNLTSALKLANEMCGPTQMKTLKTEKPLFSFDGHQTEGFALDWSSLKLGQLASGDNHCHIHLWTMAEGGKWVVDQRTLDDHQGSVEDIQWSPTEENVLASCSSDGTIRLWDTRSAPSSACVVTVTNAHSSDVNAISWNRSDPLLVSGGDDGELKVWDLKRIQHGSPVARFKHHSGPITSVQWYWADGTMFLAAGEDDQTTLWDLALEADYDFEDGADRDEPPVPPQLLFIHMGQNEIKEASWHPQLPGIALTTALSGFNIFRTVNV